MRNFRVLAALTTGCATLLIASLASAQMSVERVNAVDARLQQIKATYDKLSPTQQKMVDGYANVIQLAGVWHQYGMRFAEASIQTRLNLMAGGSAIDLVNGPLTAVSTVSDPSTDVMFSAFSGFTQSETSTARCGNNVVVGFNDSGSIFETGFFTGGGLSFSGVAVSSNGGQSFKDLGPTPPGPATNFVIGDPVVNCSNSSTFYYSQLFSTADTSGNPLSAIALSKSVDGGQTWGDPVAAVSKDGFTHLLDKSWSTIDPVHTNKIYVSYTDFDFSGTNPACPKNVRTAIEFVTSSDGGNTWSKPKVAIQVCGNSAVQGSQLAVDSHGTLHVAWVNLGDNFPFSLHQIQVSAPLRSGGGTPVTASSQVPGGDSFFLQGEFRDFLGMAMAVDRSGTATDGTLYITWDDGRDKSVPDPLGTNGTYSYDDVLLVSSADGGNTWSAPVKVNTDTQPSTGVGHDHYQPGVAVDPTGKVAVCWYDRRDDTENFSIEHFCGESTNAGLTWTNTNVGVPGFAPTHGGDILVNSIYMGDYDALTSDFTRANTGFIGAFQVQGNRGNPDVQAVSFQ
jgi:hypothetical protein